MKKVQKSAAQAMMQVTRLQPAHQKEIMFGNSTSDRLLGHEISDSGKSDSNIGVRYMTLADDDVIVRIVV